MRLSGTKYIHVLQLALAAGFVSANTLLGKQQEPLIYKHELIADIPSIGLGLWNAKGDQLKDAISTAFETGYRHLDSAAAYGNEEVVGQALASNSTPPRSSYWVTSKLWNDMHQPANVPKALEKTLSDLDVDYLDLYLMHWPVAFRPNEKPGRKIIDQETSIVDTWRAMQQLISKNRTHPEPGTTRYIGVSNFSPRQMDEIMADKNDDNTQIPYAHEFETHPWLQQQEFVDWHHNHNIKVIAYSPLANLNPTYKDSHPELPRIIDDDFFLELASNHSHKPEKEIEDDSKKKEKKTEKKKYSKTTPAQVILAWNLARNVTIIPKTIHEAFVVENYAACKISLTRDELIRVAGQDKRARFNDPSKDWGVKLFEDLDGGS